ncbi:adipocyte plasma membrane-associated protein [Paragonimus westermani]|uniref:Adipocyte plasma membrane-associated protein n=1 Tax=Paragonimus westermani TaxID=34504 RepID=A0A5J4NFL7_9TREM|nr:adipocyte plasma membrane-associated protein [Paragonimus westermani]
MNASTSNTSKRKRSNGRWILTSTLLVAILALFWWPVHPEKFTPVSYSMEPATPLPDSCIQNNRLSDFQEISVRPYHGPESLVYWNGSIYTGVAEGKLLKVDDSGLTEFARFGEPDCDSPAACGRPLGMRLSEDSRNLVVVDAYLGLFSVSLANGSVTRIFPVDDSIFPVFFDDFDFLSNGSVVLSEASMKYTLHELAYEIFEGGPNGRLVIQVLCILSHNLLTVYVYNRLIMVDPSTGRWSELLRDLRFPNGIQLHSDGQSILVAETTSMRILRVPINGGQLTLFADGLPGVPDNIRRSERGGYWIPVSNLRDGWLSHLLDWLTEWPRLRGVVLKIILKLFNHFELKTNSAMLLRLDDEGQVVEAWNDPKGLMTNVVEVCEHQGEVFTSSYFLPYIGHIKR